MEGDPIGPVLREPPLVHAAEYWDEKQRLLTYVYNGRKLISMRVPGSDEVGYRRTSDGDLQGMPFYQQLYFMVGTARTVEVVFQLSGDAINMRPSRAGREQAILAQVGRPLMFGANGLYDIAQDLLVEWHGRPWSWSQAELVPDVDGNLTARLKVELGPKPWFLNVKPHYYRTHLGYGYHEPWRWRPNLKPVAGWCSWEAYRRDVTERNIADAAAIFSRTLKPYGLEYIQLDDGFEKMPVPADANAPIAKSWLETNAQFPGGHQGAIEKIRAQGLTPGVWTSCCIMNKAFAEAQSDGLLKDAEGKLFQGDWIGYVTDCLPRTLAEHIRPYYAGLREMGYEYFKTDTIRHLLYDALQKAARYGILTNAEAESRFRAFMLCARDGIGPDTYFLGSWGVLSQAVGVVDACRISMDANPTWAGMRMQLVESARWLHTQRILFVNDPDHICVRAKFEWSRSVASLVSLSGGLFMLSDPLEVYDEKRVRMLQRCLPPLASFAGETGPLDVTYPAFTWTKLHGFAVPRENVVKAQDVELDDAVNMAGDYPTMDADHPLSSLWAFHLSCPGRRWCVVGRFATVPLPAAQAPLENFGIDPAGGYHAFDFWAQKYLGVVSGRLAVGELGLGDCQIVALVPTADAPQLLASSRHVSMDAVSVRSQAWDGRMLTLELSGVVGAQETYWFHVPQGYRLTETGGDGLTCAARQEQELLPVNVEFKEAGCRLALGFKRI